MITDSLSIVFSHTKYYKYTELNELWVTESMIWGGLSQWFEGDSEFNRQV